MSALIAAEIWGEFKRYINVVDRIEASEQLVSIMIDNDIDVDDIKDAFKSDTDIKRALTSYLDNDKDYVDEEEEDEDPEDEVYEDWED
jgi:membrane protein involved in colicin uptake